jgi:hypothetical protein
MNHGTQELDTNPLPNIGYRLTLKKNFQTNSNDPAKYQLLVDHGWNTLHQFHT